MFIDYINHEIKEFNEYFSPYTDYDIIHRFLIRHNLYVITTKTISDICFCNCFSFVDGNT